MDKNKNIRQEEIDNVWKKTWQGDESSLSVVSNRFFVESYPVFKKYIPSNAGKILELATGSGRFGVSIAKDFPNSRVYASDILEESLDLARKLAHELNVYNIEFSVQDCMNISFEDNYFDVVFADGVIQLFPNYEDAVAEMVRVLNPGGTLIVAVPNFWNFHTGYKFLLTLVAKKFEYDYEKSFKRSELREVFKKKGIKVYTEDGFYVGYGLFRLKKYHRMFHWWGRAVNRLAKILDKYTDRFFTRNFGFELVIVGKK